MTDSSRLPPKKEVALALLEGPSLFAHLDPRKDDVVVPRWLRSQPQLVLQLGMTLAVPIPDLTVGDDGISGTLSFHRAPFWCHLPWTAVYALVGEDGRGMVWPEDVPAELAQQSPRPRLSVVEPRRSKARAGAAPEPARAAVPDEQPVAAVEPADQGSGDSASGAAGDGTGDTQADGAGDAAATKKLPPYLRVVK